MNVCILKMLSQELRVGFVVSNLIIITLRWQSPRERYTNCVFNPRWFQIALFTGWKAQQKQWKNWKGAIQLQHLAECTYSTQPARTDEFRFCGTHLHTQKNLRESAQKQLLNLCVGERKRDTAWYRLSVSEPTVFPFSYFSLIRNYTMPFSYWWPPVLNRDSMLANVWYQQANIT